MSDTKMLKEKFGDRLSFHGAMDVRKILQTSSVEEVKQEVFRCAEELYANHGGYILVPCHNIG